MAKANWNDHPYGIEIRLLIVVIAVLAALLTPKYKAWRASHRVQEPVATRDAR